MNDSKGKCIALSKLFSKEVVNTVTGERLGYISDAELDVSCGEIKYFCVAQHCKNLFSKKKELKKFAYDDITKIGDDIILISSCIVLPKNRNENHKKQL